MKIRCTGFPPIDGGLHRILKINGFLIGFSLKKTNTASFP
jgi:hypothetical protein